MPESKLKIQLLLPSIFLTKNGFNLSIFIKYNAKKREQNSINLFKQQLKKSSAVLKKSSCRLANRVQQVVATDLSFTTTGWGTDELIQRTIARDVHIDYERGMVGQGRYGSVWRANWNGDQVAVKVFLSMHESSWSRETDIYQTCMLRHENILGFIASDIKGNGCSVSMLLITEYHANGSLYDYLVTHTIESKRLLVKLLFTTASGLHHLHQEIFGTAYKPAIVHRDLKTKNILVKANFECCIADFGLAVRYNSQTNRMDHEPNFGSMVKIREGSTRYMAPECLDESLNAESINDLRRTDIYSYALVIWELLSRFTFRGEHMIGEHRPPYYEFVSGDPSVQLMKDIVCLKKIRPHISSRLEEDDVSAFVWERFNPTSK